MIGSRKHNLGLGMLAVLLLALSAFAGANPPQTSGPTRDRQVLNLIRDAEERSGGLRGAFGRTEGYKTGPRAMRARARIRDLDEALKRLRFMVGHRSTVTQQREKVNEAISQGDALDEIF